MRNLATTGAMTNAGVGPLCPGIGAVIVITTTGIALIGTTKTVVVSCLHHPKQDLRLTGIASAQHGILLSLRTLAAA